LLVVMGMIALLIAILLPSLSRAREQANRTKCLNNIRQIGIGLAIYLSDNGEYPVLDLTSAKPTEASRPIFYASRRSGLLALRSLTKGFDRYNLACPDGWASQGDASFYESRGIASNGAAYMDYAYWPWRYAPQNAWDVKTASLQHRRERGTKIVVSDVVMDISSLSPQTLQTVGVGNHGSNHSGSLHVVRRTDGHRNRLGSSNKIQGSGGSALFSDGSARWFAVERLTQQADGICYPPVDQW
jgi:type II secretory pathway pseudopilin PulG